MNISGILVHARAGRAEDVARRLEKLASVEVHHITPEGKLIVTVEADDAVPAGDTLLAMHRVDGVLSAALVYHHFEPDQEAEDAAFEA